MPRITKAKLQENFKQEEEEAKLKLQQEEEECRAFMHAVHLAAGKIPDPLSSFAILLVGFIEDDLKVRNELNGVKKKWNGWPLGWERSSIMVCMNQLKGLMRILESAQKS
ncbi:MAG: hypothetical protein EXS59_02825 [Candidatus Taylorbacteria bacterium]|nr:hypothetical protein [Candidatus Taylorbacteria bacterium]